MLRRAIGWLSVLLVGCSHDVVEPLRLVEGSFGGRGTDASFQEPIQPAADGRFSLGPVLVPSKSGPAAIAVRGLFTPERIDFEATSLSSAGEVRTSQHVVHRDQPGDYTGMACLPDP
jgi:hypothetical protein